MITITHHPDTAKEPWEYFVVNHDDWNITATPLSGKMRVSWWGKATIGYVATLVEAIELAKTFASRLAYDKWTFTREE